MIEYIHIKNFLSHKNSRVDFDPGVNSIVGNSDAGKSAIIKALDWVFNNNPSGDEFINWYAGKEPAIVEIGINGHKITRLKSKTKNLYQLDDEEPDRAFGVAVPEKIAKVININPASLHRQPDPAFLISQNSPTVAAYINKIANLEIMQKSVSEINLQVTRGSRGLKTLEFDLEEKRKEQKEFRWIDNAEGFLVGLKQQQTKINKLRTKITKIKGVVAQIKENQKRLCHYDWVKIAINQLEACNALNKKRTAKIKAIKRVEAAITRVANAQEKLKKLPSLKNAKELKNLLVLGYNIKQKTNKFNALIDLTEGIKNKQNQLKDREASLKKTEENFYKLMPDICPLCGRG